MTKTLTLIIHSLVLTLLPFSLSAQNNESEIYEIVISGSYQGPPLWQVKNEENTLWIFGSLTPLAKGMDWNSNRVERVIAEAEEYLPPPSLKPDIGPTDAFKIIQLSRMESKMKKLQNRNRLDDVLEETLYQRFLDIKEQYGPRGNSILRFRPAYAADRLAETAFKKAQLVDSTSMLEKKINRLIRRYDVPVTSATIEVDIGDNWQEIQNIFKADKPLSDEILCLTETLDMIENDLSGARERALIWATGDMGELYNRRFIARQRECHQAINNSGLVQSLFAQSESLWLLNAANALKSNRNTFAVLPMNMMITQTGLLEQLRELGYEVIDP